MFAAGNARKAAITFRVAPVKRQGRLPLLRVDGNDKENAAKTNGRRFNRLSELSILTVVTAAVLIA